MELFADYPLLRLGLLLALFALVAAGVYFGVVAFSSRQLSRERLAEAGTSTGPVVGTSLRSQNAESAWLKLVNGIEKAGLSLTDTRADTVRKKMVAAGFTAPYAPRVYTVLRLALVIALPVLVLLVFWLTGSRPGLGT